MPSLENFWTQNYFLQQMEFKDKRWIPRLETINTRVMEITGENYLSNKHKILKMIESTSDFRGKQNIFYFRKL